MSAGPESGSAAVSSGLAEFSTELEGVEGASSTRTAFGAQATKAMERRKMVGFIRLGRGIWGKGPDLERMKSGMAGIGDCARRGKSLKCRARRPRVMRMDYTQKIARQVAAVPRSGIRDFFELVQGREGIISLGVGEPDFVTPWNIREAAIYSLEKGQTSYTSNLGLPSLRKSISRYVEDFFHVRYEIGEILVTVGVSEAIDLA